jgi:uncharacterized membrane protein YqjE
MMEHAGERSSAGSGAGPGGHDGGTHAGSTHAEQEPGKVRELALHVVRMFETRMDAAGIAIESEVQSFSSRVQLKLLAAGALFLAIWSFIVLLAIALPDKARVPVLGGVVLLFLLGALWAQMSAKKLDSPRGVGSLRWFLESMRLDLEVLTRSLAQRNVPHAAEKREPPDDIAA